MNEIDGLCFRCEKRALVLEKKSPPYRYECGMTDSAKMSCYAFTPVKPILIKKSGRDIRPISLNYFSARVIKSGDPDMILVLMKMGRNILAYWVPKPNKHRGRK